MWRELEKCAIITDMKILAISDTHRKISRVETLIKKHGGFDAVFHMGDHLADAEAIGRLPGMEGVRIEAVRGNCDGAMKPDECTKIVEADGFKFMLTHGHPYGVDYDLTQLYYAAKEAEVDMVLFGHTHRAFYDKGGDVQILNPGSISSPRDGSRGTYAVINTEGRTLECVTFEWDGPGDIPRRSKARGGFLRRTFNDSDGQ